MILIDVYYEETNLHNNQSICSRVIRNAYENRISFLAISCFMFSADFIGGFIVQEPAWASTVMLGTGLVGSMITLAILAREIDLRRRG